MKKPFTLGAPRLGALRLVGPLLLVLLLALVQPGRGQVPLSFRMERAGQEQVRIPLQVQRNLPVVQVRLNGAGPYNFLLDTGVANTLLTDPAIADSLHLRHGQDFSVVGAGGKRATLVAYQSPGVRVSLGRRGHGIVAEAMSLLVLAGDSLNLSGYVGMPVHGILGSELFHSLTVAFGGADSETLVFTDPAAFRPPRGHRWTVVPLAIEGHKAYLTAAVRQAGDAKARFLKLVLDTGASHALSLETTSDPDLRLPNPRLYAELGHGLGGPVHGSLGRVADVQLGPYQLRAVLTSFPNAADVHMRTDVPRNGNLGYDLLRRFRVVIDYPHQCLWLRPGPSFREPFEHDMAGFELLALGPALRRYQVTSVTPGSPAAAAGMEVGEELLTVGLAPVAALSLTQLSRLLNSNDGMELFLVLRRPNGELHAANLRLKRRI